MTARQRGTSDAAPTVIYRIYRTLLVPALLVYLLMVAYALLGQEGAQSAYTGWARMTVCLVIGPMAMAIGWLIMRRVPGNVIGPAVIVYGAVIPVEFVSDLQLPPAQHQVNLLLLGLVWAPTFILIITHFPSGRIVPRWITPLFMGYIGIQILTISLSFFSLPFSYFTEVSYVEPQPNPFAVTALLPYGTILDEINGLVSLAGILLALTTLILRYRKADSGERAQFRWFLFGIAVTVAMALPWAYGLQWITERIGDQFGSMASVALAASVPVAIGMGIFLHRLYDIDLIIRRTFTYSAVSLLLVLTYFGLVLLLQMLLGDAIAGDNPLVIVGSTLMVAALFNPVFRRVQQIVDRLFHRNRYNTEQILRQFRSRVQHLTAPQPIGEQMVQTVERTVQPRHLALWIPEPMASLPAPDHGEIGQSRFAAPTEPETG